jgi:hypothetical protein
MPIVFEEIHGEVAPRRGQEGAEQDAAPEKPDTDPAELIRRELQLIRERKQRLCAE